MAKKLFIDREDELRFFHDRMDQMERGDPLRIALWGHRRIGKTMLIREIVEECSRRGVIALSVDLEGIVGTPEIFAARYAEEILKSYHRSLVGRVDDFADLHDLMTVTDRPDVRNAVIHIIQELARTKVDRNRLITMGFDLPRAISEAEKRPVVVFLDEFQSLLELEKYQGTKDIVGVFRSRLERQEEIGYVLAGSAITVIRSLIIDEKSPLYLQFERLELRPFEKASARRLVRRFIEVDARAFGRIYAYTGGHPFYLTTLCRRLRASGRDRGIDESEVSLAFLQEVLSPDGTIFNYCNYLYRHTIESVRGRGIVMSILEVLSRNPGRNQSEIAQALHQAQGTVRNYLLPLVEIDVIRGIDNRYSFADPLFSFWILNHRHGVARMDLIRREDVKEAVRDLERRYRGVALELGRAKESDVRELMKSFRGQEVDGRLFHSESDVTLVRMKEVGPYNSADGKTDLDAVAANRKRWAVEVKWRARSSGLRELESFRRKVGRYEKIEGKRVDVLWFISKAGFTGPAVDFGRKNGMYLSTGEDYGEIARWIGG